MRPQPGITPTREWVSPNLACSLATRKSQLSASSNPPVMATPLTAPISGLLTFGNGPRMPSPLRPPSAPLPPPRLPADDPSSFRSSPAQNAGSVPVRIRTSTSAFASASRIRSGSSRSTSLDSALRASGRLSVIVAIRSRHLEQYAVIASSIPRPCPILAHDAARSRNVPRSRAQRANSGIVRVERGYSRSSAGRKASCRSPSFTSVEAIQPPSAPKWSSSNVLVPSATVSSASSYRPS